MLVVSLTRLIVLLNLSEGTCIVAPEEIKKNGYYSLVRPHLEYASRMSDPHTQKQINDIKGVQRRAARFVKRCYDHRTTGSVTRLLNDLQCPSLEVHRKEARLTTLYKAINGKIDLQIIEHVKPRQRNTIHYHPIKFTHLTPASNT